MCNRTYLEVVVRRSQPRMPVLSGLLRQSTLRGLRSSCVLTAGFYVLENISRTKPGCELIYRIPCIAWLGVCEYPSTAGGLLKSLALHSTTSFLITPQLLMDILHTKTESISSMICSPTYVPTNSVGIQVDYTDHEESGSNMRPCTIKFGDARSTN